MLTITALPAFNDNYIWLLQNTATFACAVVDPGDASPVLQWLKQNPKWTLSQIFITHHHHDHTGGIIALKQTTGATVYGPLLETVAGVDCQLEDQQQVHFLTIFSLHCTSRSTLGTLLITTKASSPCCSVVTLCFLLVVAVSLKAQQNKCTTPYKPCRPCPTTR